MIKTWRLSGRIAFWAALPLLHIYLRARRRTRVLVVSEGKVLLVRGWLSNGKWHLPGGGLHFREHASHGAVREVREETGVLLLPSQLGSVGLARFKGHGLRFTYEQFIVELPGIVPLVRQKGEIIDTEWVSIEDISPRNAESDVVQLLAMWQGLR